jgi:hypothetical protein
MESDLTTKPTGAVRKNLGQPWPNTYWVPGGRLLAGEYPGAFDAEIAARHIDGLLDVGIRAIIDLTREGELPPYDGILHRLSSARLARVRYERLAIRDASIPDRQLMNSILDTIDAEHARDHRVYVHCWGGIGRTGTVIACHLVRKGATGIDALAQLTEYFSAMEKSSRCSSPETHEQKQFVIDWEKVERPE